MKKLLSTYLLNIIAAMALMMTAAACVDDTDIPEVAAPGTSVTIRIPNPAAADAFARSRAEADADSPVNAATNVGASGSSPAAAASRAEEKDLDTELEEGSIKTLWLLAYNTDNSDYNVIRQLQSSGQLTHEYSEYRIEFKPGKYRIYVVANLDQYIATNISASTEESYLENLILNFSPDKLPNTTDGLPMACLPAKVDGADTDGIITVEAGKTKEILTDLTFLCAKVRYTILFDNSDGGFSREAFGASTVTFNSASLTGVIPSTPLYGSVNASADAFEVDPIDLKAVNASNDLSDLAPNGFTPSATGAQRAWQGTMYLPENLLTGARTVLHLGATLDGNGANLSYTVKLPNNVGASGSSPENTLTRGHFYDLVGRVTTVGDQIDITASVADWTLQTLTYALHGPYFLHVDKTKIEDLVAGLEKTITYETDAPDIKFESCDYDGKKLFIVDKGVDEETGKNYISVKVNSEIAASGAVLEGNQYYFDIIAANLRKRILVTPVKLTPFLNVSPTEIEINIAEYIASGDYEAEIPIEFTTNLPSVTITQTGDTWSDFPITFEGITTDGTVTYNNTSTRTNTLKITGFNNGIWTSEQKFQLTFTAPSTDDKTVNITVKPNQLNYLIHFRAPKGWTNPHIYIYQCLQLPATHPSNPSKTLGYKDIYTENGQQKINYLSALEYSFTGKVAFKGWNYTNNDDVNYYNQSGNMDNGFYIFNDYTNWNCTTDFNNNKDHYYFNLDFCATYRDSISGTTSHSVFTSRCAYCGANHVNTRTGNSYTNGYNMLWPGIMMRNDGNSWWTFELTGTATPGKALIMFTDSHNESTNRYPDALQPGVPLFDYPSREGWFDLAAGATQFTSTPHAPKRTYRIYWPQNNNSTNKNFIHIWLNGPIPLTDWATNTGKSDASCKFYYDDFEILESCSSSTRVNYQLGKSGDGWNKSVTLSQFTKIKGENVYAITLDTNGNYTHSGTPDDPAQQPDVTTYRLYWPYASTSFNGVNFWKDDKAWGNTEYNSDSPQSTNNGTYKKSTEYPGYAYLEFTETSTAEFHCQHMPGYSHKTDNIYLSNFSGSGNIKSYTLNPNSPGGHSGTPIISNIPTYRIWWFKDDRNACHIEGIYTGGSDNELNHGEATYGGRTCYFYDIQTDKDPIKVWLYKQENHGYTNEYEWSNNNNSNASKFNSTSGQYFKYETQIY